MKTFLLNLFIFTTLFSYSQTPNEKNIIIRHYNLNKLDSLKIELIKENTINNIKIQDYINTHNIEKRVLLDNGKLMEIKYIYDDKPVYISTHNLNAAKSTKTINLHSGGALNLNLEGQNMILGIWDGGSVLTTHQEFFSATGTTARVSIGDIGAVSSNHATHVAGTLIAKGTDSNARGMAPQANLISYDWNNDEAEVINEVANNALLITNHSYGVPVLTDTGNPNAPTWMMGCYNTDALNWDNISYNAPYSLNVMSAGNDGNSIYTGGLLPTGYDKLTGNKNSKNNLVVANADPFILPNGFLNLIINSSSSQGPCDDGRIKPDIAADGTNLYSSISTSDLSYSTYSGTSMASPNTAGTLILLQQYYNQLNSKFMKSATLKGLVCHTAQDDLTRIGPDPIFGWGLLNAKKAAQTIQQDFNSTDALILENTLNEGQTYTYTINANDNSPLSATICWTDPAGTNQSNILNSTIPALVNDLDLRITDSGANTFMPWKLQLSDITANAITGDNTVDNIENIDIATPTVGTYTLTVSHKGVLTNGSQNYSLIITGTNTSLGIEKNTINEFLVWPNPTSDKLFFKLNTQNNNNLTVNLFDIQGRKVFTKSYSNSSETKTINTTNLTSGLYFIKINQGNKQINKKIIIK